MPETTPLADKSLTCRDCKNTFIFTVGEQKFFAEKGFDQPTRCKACRQARKEARPVDPSGPGSSFQTRSEVDLFTGTPPDGGKRSRKGGGKRRGGYDED